MSWGLKDTHKSWWECDTGIAYLVSGVEGWRVRRMTEVFDLSDPAKPVKIRDFGLVGQQPGATGAIPDDLHGAISLGPQANRIYFGYGTNKGGVLQIVDREKLLEGSEGADAREPALSGDRRARHDAVQRRAHDLSDDEDADREFAKDKDGATRDIVMIVDEQIANECHEPRQMVWFVDVTIENKPMVDVELPGAGGERQFLRARRPLRLAFAEREHGAGVLQEARLHRLFQCRRARRRRARSLPARRRSATSSPRSPRRPTSAASRSTARSSCKVAIQSNNVETDDRGYIYIVDRANTGMHILEVTGEARAVAGLPPQ